MIGGTWWINLDGKGGAVKGSALRSPPCRQSSVSLTAIHRDAFSSPMGRPSGEWLSDIRYFGGSARFGEQQKKVGSNRLDGDSRG